jgi:hypothetical protein
VRRPRGTFARLRSQPGFAPRFEKKAFAAALAWVYCSSETQTVGEERGGGDAGGKQRDVLQIDGGPVDDELVRGRRRGQEESRRSASHGGREAEGDVRRVAAAGVRDGHAGLPSDVLSIIGEVVASLGPPLLPVVSRARLQHEYEQEKEEQQERRDRRRCLVM